MTDVFISYAREDSAQAERIARGLEAAGLTAFWDNEIPPGQTWADYIEGKLNQCSAAVVLWSEHSTKSQWVREEARMGRTKLIPAKLDASEPPFGFGDVQAADLSSWGGDYNHPQWARFVNAVLAKARPGGAQPAGPAPHVTPQAQPPAGGWQQPQSNQSSSGWQTPPQQTQQQAWASGASPSAAGVENLTPVQYIQKCLRLITDGKGRARRAEYWWFFLFAFVALILVSVIGAVLFGVNQYTMQPNSQLLTNLASIALFTSVTARRFHDVGLSGWLVAPFYALSLVAGFLVGNPLIGLLVLVAALATLVITLLPSKPGPNQYGPNPKGL